SNAINELDSNSEELRNGSASLSSGLKQFQERSKSLSSLQNINETAINPMANGIKQLDSGINKLSDSTGQLKNGSDQYESSFEKFQKGLSDYKTKGIDKLSDKSKDITQAKDILDQMSKLAKENNSITGTSDNFETKSRIIEKIK
ncbi:MAG: hypothetical protein E6427_03400, partial [Anaerococcus sp.]|nr:hypothetical protein [Anaerococcus sp.]